MLASTCFGCHRTSRVTSRLRLCTRLPLSIRFGTCQTNETAESRSRGHAEQHAGSVKRGAVIAASSSHRVCIVESAVEHPFQYDAADHHAPAEGE